MSRTVMTARRIEDSTQALLRFPVSLYAQSCLLNRYRDREAILDLIFWRGENAVKSMLESAMIDKQLWNALVYRALPTKIS